MLINIRFPPPPLLLSDCSCFINFFIQRVGYHGCDTNFTVMLFCSVSSLWFQIMRKISIEEVLNFFSSSILSFQESGAKQRQKQANSESNGGAQTLSGRTERESTDHRIRHPGDREVTPRTGSQ